MGKPLPFTGHFQAGGMQVDEATQALMTTQLDTVPLKTHAGIQALYEGLASGETHL